MRGARGIALFHYIALRAFCHETEDPEKVRRALRHAAHVADLPLEETTVEGAHGNRILILEGTAKSAQAERALLRDLARDDPDGYVRLAGELEARLDENLNVHFRLDKQEAFLGRTRLASGGEDAVTARGKVRSFPAPGADPRARALADVRSALAGVPKG